MQAKMRLLGHPIHQMLIVFPLGLLATAVLFDVIHLVSTDEQRFEGLAYWLIVSGIVGGLVASPFGTLDWLKIPAGTRAKRIGAIHGLGNVVVLALFAVSALLRTSDLALEPPPIAYVLSFAGATGAVVTGWLGGELVDRLGVGVDDGANLNAPSSLTVSHVPKVSRAKV
jgi:uncharacterized membrane protein